MTWGPWRSHLRLRSGQVVTTRKARTDAVPLHVELPVGWQFVAGTGAVGVATDINDDWQPRTVTEGIALLEEALATIGPWREIARMLSHASRGPSVDGLEAAAGGDRS